MTGRSTSEAVRGAATLAAAFSRAATENRSALIGYLPAGYPTIAGCREALRAMVAGGVDIVEVGLPYSDPLMDGPTIQQAVDTSLAEPEPTRIHDVVDTVRDVAATGAAVLVMTYWNPVEQYGPERFAAEVAEAGGAGVITPDLTPEEGTDWTAACAEHGLAPVFLVAPSSTEDRLSKVAQASGGFVYVASTMGVTGARTAVAGTAQETVARTRDVTDLPLAVGLGVSTADQAAEVAGYADGVIVGSAFVRTLQQAGDQGASAVRSLAEQLAEGVRRRDA